MPSIVDQGKELRLESGQECGSVGSELQNIMQTLKYMVVRCIGSAGHDFRSGARKEGTGLDSLNLCICL